MSKFYKIYHYSKKGFLDSIDPNYYGTGVSASSELRRGKRGINKSFFYTKDEPEEVTRGGVRHEVYLPYSWKSLIYDIGDDPDQLFALAKKKLIDKGECPLYYLILETLENHLKDNGYKGWSAKDSPLPHAIVIFHALSTKKPEGAYTAYQWADDKILEQQDNDDKESAEKIPTETNRKRKVSSSETIPTLDNSSTSEALKEPLPVLFSKITGEKNSPLAQPTDLAQIGAVLQFQIYSS